jgi:hypothetical protein
MKSGIVVLATAATALAATIPEARSIPKHAPHSGDHAPVVNPAPDSNEDTSEVCIQFTSDDPTWGWAQAYPWGSSTGTFGSLPGGQMCVPTSNSAGGALFIGPSSNPGPGSTKLECFFPTSGQANCDVSLVDGYSLSVTCTAGDVTVGGPIDLWTTGTPCPDTSAISQGICKNDNSYDSDQSDVDAFFQPAITGGNEYCIWWACGQDYYFPVNSTVSCHISGTAET